MASRASSSVGDSMATVMLETLGVKLECTLKAPLQHTNHCFFVS
jgi:hypothetical protein